MNQDPAVRQEAHSRLVDLFTGIGNRSTGQATDPLTGMVDQLEELFSMPVDLARIFIEMAVDLTDAVLTSLEEAGIVLVKGLTPL